MIRNTTAILATALVVATLTGAARAQGVSVGTLPPSVVKTEPTCGDTRVNPNTTQIKVTFSRERKPSNRKMHRAAVRSFLETTALSRGFRTPFKAPVRKS